jgi:hypothetical protein
MHMTVEIAAELAGIGPKTASEVMPIVEKLRAHAPPGAEVQGLPSIPRELDDLALYRADEELLRAWPSLLPALQASFPGVDVISEVRRAHGWEVTHPSNRKTHRAAYLWNWLERSHNRAPAAKAASLWNGIAKKDEASEGPLPDDQLPF